MQFIHKIHLLDNSVSSAVLYASLSFIRTVFSSAIKYIDISVLCEERGGSRVANPGPYMMPQEDRGLPM